VEYTLLKRAAGWAAHWRRRWWTERYGKGPDSFLSEKPAATELCRELGLGADLIPSNDEARKTFISGEKPDGAAADG